jgi:hypothetical protein
MRPVITSPGLFCPGTDEDESVVTSPDNVLRIGTASAPVFEAWSGPACNRRENSHAILLCGFSGPSPA